MSPKREPKGSLQCVNMADRPTRLRNKWFGFQAFVIFLLSRVCL